MQPMSINRDKAMKQKSISVRELCGISIFTAVIAVCAQVVIPMPYGVPMTLQTFAVPLAGVILGTKNGALSALIYVLLGITGLPVFAGFTGGIGIVFGRTGGFILSFPLMALTAGIGAKNNTGGRTVRRAAQQTAQQTAERTAQQTAERTARRTAEQIARRTIQQTVWQSVWLIIGTAINFICGMLVFGLVTSNSPIVSFVYVVLPFIPTAIIKIVMVVVFGRLIGNALEKSGTL